MDNTVFYVFIMLAILIEAVLGSWKDVFVSKKVVWFKVAALALGVLVCVGANIDLFEAVGAPMMFPYVGSVLSGMIAGRGSNYVYELMKTIRGLVSSEK